MKRARLGVAVLFVLALAAGTFALFPSKQPRAGATTQRQTLLLLTSLPLLFGEDFSLEGSGSPALKALQARYRVVPISVTSGPELAKGRLLLMAHPQAQTAESLVSLDEWVRNGGRLLLLADPMLEWPSERPLGDPLRPPPMFMDTGLLEHWGLSLEGPAERGPVRVGGGHNPVLFVSPGRLQTKQSNCVLSRADIVAKCTIGRGRALVVADADFLNPAIATLTNPKVRNTAELMELLISVGSN